jgi:hypothetical protein
MHGCGDAGAGAADDHLLPVTVRDILAVTVRDLGRCAFEQTAWQVEHVSESPM